MEEYKHCTHCWGKIAADATNCPYCGTVLASAAPPVPPKPAELGLTKKEEKQARKIYSDYLLRKKPSDSFWVIAAAAWGLFGLLLYFIGGLDGNDSPLGALLKLFGLPTVIMLLFAVWSNAKSKKKLQALQAKVDAMDSALVAYFDWEIKERKTRNWGTEDIEGPHKKSLDELDQELDKIKEELDRADG